MSALFDAYGREFLYLRLSLTDVCNFRCQYCLPDGYHCEHGDGELSLPEIHRVVRAFVGLGLWKVRLTGGEPSLRRDLNAIIETVAAVPGVRRIAMTTNGYRLHRDVTSWRNAGLNALNVSIDSFDPRLFASLTGHDRLRDILDGLETALTLGFESLKLNAVLLREFNANDLQPFLTYLRERPVDIRFIELMQTGTNHAYFQAQHVGAGHLRQFLAEQGWLALPRQIGDGPAENFAHPDYRGRIGLIAPYAPDFCAGCNRLRITARGQLSLCLFSDEGADLRPLLASDTQQAELEARIRALLIQKKASHYLAEGITGATRHFAAIGG